ncbi:acyltransferase [Clostridium sp. UBA1056]|uniref:acyltransferase n=1 Tax=unclassified Clostridium TaxID=2614128 RepID=UPI003217065E
MRKYYYKLDILRGIAIIGVLLIHITSILVSQQDVFSIFINQASRFAVPTFLFLSGLGITISNKLKRGYRNFLLKQMEKIIPLYSIYSLIYYLVKYRTFSILGFVKGFFLGRSYYHLYYVTLIFLLYSIYPIILKLVKKKYGILIALFITVLSQELGIFTGMNIFNNKLNIFNWIFYFSFGAWFADNFESKVDRIKKNKIEIFCIFIVSLVGVFLESYLSMNKLGVGMATTSMRPSIILLSVLFVLLILSIDWKDNLFKKITIKLSNLSYGIYLSHVLVLEGYRYLHIKILGTSINSCIYVIITFIIVMLLSILLTIIMNKLMDVLSNVVNKKDNVIGV